MPRRSVFEWPDGVGWLVLSGLPDSSRSVRARAIERVAADGAVVCLVFGSDKETADTILQDLQDLGASSGYLVDVLTEDDETIRQQIASAGLVVVHSSLPDAETIGQIKGAALAGVEAAYQRGAVLLIEGHCVSIWGESFFDGSAWRDGLQWLRRTVATTSPDSVDTLRYFLDKHPQGVSLMLPIGAAFVLGGGGQIETWGTQQAAIALGAAYTANESD